MILATSVDLMKASTRDVTQAYVQITTKFGRDVYLSAPKVMVLPPNIVLKVVRPLYDIPESGFHWYLPKFSLLFETFGMTRSK